MVSGPRHARKRDVNELEIVRGLERVGATVERMDPFDLLVLFRGEVYLLEVKQPDGPRGGKRGHLTQTQEKMIRAGWPLHIVKNVPEALAAIGAWKEGSDG